MSAPPTADELLLGWDRSRPRTQQAELGMSAVGSCRRRAGYIVNGVEPTDPGGSVPAVLGTAIHEVLADAVRKLDGDVHLIEAEVTFAGVRGHLDLLWVDPDSGWADLVDHKSVSSARFDQAQTDGPSLNHTYQTALYAAAAARLGYRIRSVIIDYIHRDSGRTYRHRRPFSLDEVEAALGWLDTVRTTDLDELPRDFRPGSPHCDSCPFRTDCWGSAVPGRSPLSALYVDHPDAVAWVDQLEEGKRLKAEGARLYEDAKGALDALRDVDRGKTPHPIVVDGPGGTRKALRWSVYDDTRLDTEAVKADYAEMGVAPPTKRSEVVKLTLVPRPETGDQGG